jgi:hypothetical protein
MLTVKTRRDTIPERTLTDKACCQLFHRTSNLVLHQLAGSTADTIQGSTVPEETVSWMHSFVLHT